MIWVIPGGRSDARDALGEQRPQRSTRQQLHHQEGCPVLGHRQLEDLHYAGVIQAGAGHHFALQRLRVVFTSPPGHLKGLDGHRAAALLVDGPVHHAHAPAP